MTAQHWPSLIFVDFHQRCVGLFPSALHHDWSAVRLRDRALRQLHGVLDPLCHFTHNLLHLLLSDAGVSVFSPQPRPQARGDCVFSEAPEQVWSCRPERGRWNSSKWHFDLRIELSVLRNRQSANDRTSHFDVVIKSRKRFNNWSAERDGWYKFDRAEIKLSHAESTIASEFSSKAAVFHRLRRSQAWKCENSREADWFSCDGKRDFYSAFERSRLPWADFRTTGCLSDKVIADIYLSTRRARARSWLTHARVHILSVESR